VFKPLIVFRLFSSRQPSGPRTYKMLAVTPEAHARIVAKADKRGETIVDYIDKLAGV
jgi:hypothetical protein